MPSVYPPLYDTAVGQVRLLIPDTAHDGDGLYLFEDEQIEALLALYADNVRYAAARAKDIIATDQTLLTKVIRTDDLSVNGAALGTELRLQAKSLREEADKSDEAWDFFQIVYPDVYTYPPEATPRPFEILTTF